MKVRWKDHDWTAHETVEEHAAAVGVNRTTVIKALTRLAVENDLPLPNERGFRLEKHGRRAATAWHGTA